MSACPICAKPLVQDYRPFCSPRCRLVDLNRWMTGGYQVPGEAVGPEAETGSPEQDEA